MLTALSESLAYQSDQGEPLAMIGLVTGWAGYASSFEEFIAPLRASLTGRTCVAR